jgi:hypothetical protein
VLLAKVVITVLAVTVDVAIVIVKAARGGASCEPPGSATHSVATAPAKKRLTDPVVIFESFRIHLTYKFRAKFQGRARVAELESRLQASTPRKLGFSPPLAYTFPGPRSRKAARPAHFSLCRKARCMDTKTADNVVGELEDKLKQRDRTILELRQEAEEAQALIAELREHAQDHVETLESWIEAFEIVAGDDGHYHWPNVYRQYNELVDSYDALRREWNRLVPKYNAAIEPRGLGRPLAASEAQQRKVLAMRKAGESLRAIVSGTGLTLRTVRTIIGKADGTDRTTKRTNEIRRLELNRNRMAAYRARKRTRDALPKRITDLLARGKSLVKRAR